MKIVFEGSAKEIADFVLAVQNQQEKRSLNEWIGPVKTAEKNDADYNLSDRENFSA